MNETRLKEKFPMKINVTSINFYLMYKSVFNTKSISLKITYISIDKTKVYNHYKVNFYFLFCFWL